MSDTFGTVPEVVASLDWDPAPNELAEIERSLEMMTDEARLLGRHWTVDSVPRIVKNNVLASVIRFVRNAESLVQSRAGDESLTWTDLGELAGRAYFDSNQTATIRTLAGHSPLQSTPVYAWSDKPARTVVYVPVASHSTGSITVSPAGYVISRDPEDPFPLFAAEDEYQK